jgi:hypothetical protein
MHAAEARLHHLDQSLCPHCDYRIERDFIRCPSCLRKLKERCANCSRPLDQAWTICPYCEADVPGLSAPRSRRRRAAVTESDLSEMTQASDPVSAEETAAEEPVAASESASRPRGRSRRPSSGRPRPSS